jgi:hypothetical protein
MYKLTKSIYAAEVVGVIRSADGASIPFDPANTDYQQYLKFLEKGGQPLPADDNGQAAE